MRTVLTIVAAIGIAVPAFAQDAGPFIGARIGATLGWDRALHSGVTYGGAIGYDALVAPKITVGAEASFEDSTAKGNGFRASRDVAISGRVGYILTPNVLGFAKVGYDTTRDEFGAQHTSFEGVRFGGGLEYAVTKHVYVSTEYRRTEYEANLGGRNAVIAGAGVRF
jgi:outer membrane immunogenic protein